MPTLIVILGNTAMISLQVLYLYILKEKLPFQLYFHIASLIVSDRCVILHCAPSVAKQREMGVYAVVPVLQNGSSLLLLSSCRCCCDKRRGFHGGR